MTTTEPRPAETPVDVVRHALARLDRSRSEADPHLLRPPERVVLVRAWCVSVGVPQDEGMVMIDLVLALWALVFVLIVLAEGFYGR